MSSNRAETAGTENETDYYQSSSSAPLAPARFFPQAPRTGPSARSTFISSMHNLTLPAHLLSLARSPFPPSHSTMPHVNLIPLPSTGSRP